MIKYLKDNDLDFIYIAIDKKLIKPCYILSSVVQKKNTFSVQITISSVKLTDCTAFCGFWCIEEILKEYLMFCVVLDMKFDVGEFFRLPSSMN